MPLVPAICTQCGAQLKIDPSQKRTYCQMCGTEFLTEQAINNYNITLNLDDQKKATLLAAGDQFLQFEEYINALAKFEELRKDYPTDYRGWWGCIVAGTYSFSREKTVAAYNSPDFVKKVYDLHVDMLQKLLKIAPAEMKEGFEQKWAAYARSMHEYFVECDNEKAELERQKAELEKRKAALQEEIDKLQIEVKKGQDYHYQCNVQLSNLRQKERQISAELTVAKKEWMSGKFIGALAAKKKIKECEDALAQLRPQIADMSSKTEKAQQKNMELARIISQKTDELRKLK